MTGVCQTINGGLGKGLPFLTAHRNIPPEDSLPPKFPPNRRTNPTSDTLSVRYQQIPTTVILYAYTSIADAELLGHGYATQAIEFPALSRSSVLHPTSIISQGCHI